MAIGCFVSVGRTLQDAVARVTLAEELGYEAAYVTHIAARDSLTVLAAYAAATSRIGLGTGVVPIYTRTPATMAMTAATLHEQSGGRLRLGLGVSHRPVVEGWHGQTIDKPVAEMREYVAIVRAILAGEPPPRGEKWQTSFALSGIGPYPELPIYIAALSPAMLRLAGEVADGAMLWLCNPEYIRAVVTPELRAGRERAGKTMEDFDVVAAVPSAVVEDPAVAFAAMRGTCWPTSACRSTARCSSARASRRTSPPTTRPPPAATARHAGGDLRPLPARAVRHRLARRRPRRLGALCRRGRDVAVRGTGGQDRLRGDAAGGGARLDDRPRPTSRRTTPATGRRVADGALVRPRHPGGTARRLKHHRGEADPERRDRGRSSSAGVSHPELC